MSDIVERLRDSAIEAHRYTLAEKAADEIEALRAEVERLRAALVCLRAYQSDPMAHRIIDTALGTGPSPGPRDTPVCDVGGEGDG